MNQLFDYFGYPELPYVILCNPSKEELYSLGLAYDRAIVLRFNALSEFSFSFPRSIDGGITTIDAYEFIQNKRVVHVEGYGYFQIVDVKEDLDGSVPVKNVSCKSLECELVQKRVAVYSGTKKLYDIISPTGTILHDMISIAPNWSVGTIDAELTVKYRTFNISNSNVYGFLTENVSKAFECVFIFDTINKTISAKATSNATERTDIFLSFNNIISNAEFSEKSDEIVTAMSCYGGGDLTIRNVNPLGTNYIYDFSYYANSDWMSSELVVAIQAWESLVQSKQTEYSNLLSTLRTYKTDLITLQGELSDLESEMTVLETTKSVRVQGGESLLSINSQIASKQSEINSKNAIISNKQLQIDSITDQLEGINSDVSFDNNFTSSQLSELNEFIFENTYQNSNIIVTDSMTPVEIQDASQDLYNQSLNVLEKVSQPRYELSFDSVNFIVLQEFSTFTSQMELGSLITCEIKDGSYVETVLLELSFNFDDPTDFKMTFSNRLRLDGEGYKYSDLIGQVVQTGTQVSFNSDAWSNWENDYKDDVSNFIRSSLDTSVNNIVTSSGQDMKIDQTGIRGRKSDGAGGFLGEQIWITNNTIAFSDDGFNTARLVLGNVSAPGGGTAFGLVADYIVGRILAGNSLSISNESNNFTLDGSGATLNNAKFNVQTTNTKISIDPTATNPFSIQKNQGGTWTNKFVVSNAGDVTFSGTLSGASGSFSGSVSASIGAIGTLVIDSQGLKTSNGTNYLRGDGSLKWGGLTISGSTASFSGTIFANKISGEIQDSQIGYGLNAEKITVGTLNAIDIYGSNIYWDGVWMGSSGYGVSTIRADRLEFTREDASGNVFIDDGIVTVYGRDLISLSSSWGILELNNIYLYSNISGDGGYGYSDTIRIQTSAGYRYFVFDNGILTNVY